MQKRGNNQNNEPQITAQYTHKGGNNKDRNNNRGKWNNNNNSGQNYSQNQSQHFRQASTGRSQSNQNTNYGSYTGQPSNPITSSTWHPNSYLGQPKVICQLCDKPGHTAKTCRSKPKPWQPQAHYKIGRAHV